jgi:hypothetical protein
MHKTFLSGRPKGRSDLEILMVIGIEIGRGLTL